jgi:hypothetical protein
MELMNLKHLVRDGMRGLVGTNVRAARANVSPEEKLKELRRRPDDPVIEPSVVADPAVSPPIVAPPALFRAEANWLTKDDRNATYEGNALRVDIRPQPTYPHTIFRIEDSATRIFQENLYYSHHGLAKLLTKYRFDTILEIGSATGTAARALAFAGKTVHTCEILPVFDSDFSGDYLDLRLSGGPVEAIWCSHVLEHQRHVGHFLEKMHDDLREEGVLALTVPSALSPLLIGHCNIFTPMHLIYNLVLAGFDCADANILTYDGQFSILLRKRSNGIPRISFASTHFEFDTESLGHVPNLVRFFPTEVQDQLQKNGNCMWGEVEAINWGMPQTACG